MLSKLMLIININKKKHEQKSSSNVCFFCNMITLKHHSKNSFQKEKQNKKS